MIDFATLQGLTIPEGVVTKIESGGVVLWELTSGGNTIVLEVEKYTSNTYAGETTYKNESFILLDIYPKTNGTVSITYGGLTKTVTDTSGAEEPNAQQVFFGTFNGVSDSVETPASGTLTIEGDCYAFGQGGYSTSSKNVGNPHCPCVLSIGSFGETTVIPDDAFGNAMSFGKLTNSNLIIPNQIKKIGIRAFINCYLLQSVTIGTNVTNIGLGAFNVSNKDNSLTTVTLLATAPPELGLVSGTDYVNFGEPSDEYFKLETITVPAGCGNAYKNADGWSKYADYIVEAS